MPRGEARRARCAIAAWIAALLPFGPVAAQDDAIEEVVVTGSRIARADFESASPIVTLPASAFEQTSAITVERTLNTLPQFAASATGTSNNPANDGQANVSLRGIGVAQTLVLIDGRRLLPADGRGSPDLNVLPPALISSVEVMTGGASAAYGSDAIAGVVNFKLIDHFDGVNSTASGRRRTAATANEYMLGLTAGQFVRRRSRLADGVRRVHRPSPGEPVGPGILAGSTEVLPGRNPRGWPGWRVPRIGQWRHRGRRARSCSPNPVVFNNRVRVLRLSAGLRFRRLRFRRFAGIGVNPDGSLFTTGDDVHAGSVVNYRGVVDPALSNSRFGTPTTTHRLPRCRCRSIAPRFSCTEPMISRPRRRDTFRRCIPTTR